MFLCALFAIPGVAVGVLAAFLLAAFDTRFNVFGVALGDPCLAAACTKDCNRLCVVALLGLVEARENDTHQSTTDLEAKLYRKADGREAKLAYLGHALMENRNGLAVGGMVTQADGTAERRASEAMLKKQAKGSKRITVGEDKAYDTSDHIAALRRMNVTPHVAQNDSLTKTGKRRRSAIDARTTRHIGYQISQTCRKMAECIFGWGKQHGTMRKTKHRGTAAVAADFMLNLIAYNLVRIPKLIAA